MKFALAQVNTTVGDLRGNTEIILAACDQSRRLGAALVIFPEQTLGGYPALDLWEEPGFAAANESALTTLAGKVRGISALVGFISRNKSRIGKPVRNSVALLQNGKIMAVRHKTLLPTYDIFDESRYFEPATGNRPIKWKGLKLGVTICEDAWAHDRASPRQLYSIDPLSALIQAGADILINLSASPFSIGKPKLRSQLLAKHAKRSKRPFLYCNAVGGNDEILFDGGSLAFDSTGTLSTRAYFGRSDLRIIDTDNWHVIDSKCHHLTLF